MPVRFVSGFSGVGDFHLVAEAYWFQTLFRCSSTSCSICISRDWGMVSKERKRWGGLCFETTPTEVCHVQRALSHALSFTCFHTRSLSLSLSLTCTCIRNGAPSQTAHFESSESLQSQNTPVSDLIYGVTMCVRVIKRWLPCEGSQPWLIAV